MTDELADTEDPGQPRRDDATVRVTLVLERKVHRLLSIMAAMGDTNRSVEANAAITERARNKYHLTLDRAGEYEDRRPDS